MRKSFLSVTFTLALAFVSTNAMADPRGPSTPQERQRALDVIQKLEQEPMSPALKQDRDWVFQWIREVPDLDVRVCSVVLKPLTDQKNSPERNALMLQSMLSSAEYSMRNEGKKKSAVEMYMAGVEGMLRAYHNILKQDPSKKNPAMEDMLRKQREGQLEAYVREGAAECAKHPVTTLNP